MSNKSEIELSCNQESFSFDLYHRTLNFGTAGKGEYYWMDGRGLRRGSGGNNLRSCIDFSWSCVEEAEDSNDEYNQVNLVLAEAYSLVNTSRAMQNVFLDAQLHKNADRKIEYESDHKGRVKQHSTRTYQLPQEEKSHLQQIVQSRDIREIQREFETLFRGDQPPANERPAFVTAAQHWIGNGVVAFKKGGRQGLNYYIHGDLKKQITQFRKGGINERVRLFLNMFSYECKVAFYLCYANAWAFLLPKLKQQEEISENAIRFMQLWHNQNQPQEVEGGEILNVFSGQVLSLHPLSAVILTDPVSMVAIGNWIGHPDYQQLTAENNVGSSEEYWNIVLTILIAAHEYRGSHQRWNESRGQTEFANNKAVTLAKQGEKTFSETEAFESYVAENLIFCEKCSGILEYKNYAIEKEEDSPCIATYFCSQCQYPQIVEIQFEDFQKSLIRQNDETDD